MRGQASADDRHGSASRGGAGGSNDVVLIVDDDAGFREAVAELITEEGLAPVGAANGRQALEMLTSGLRPVAILLDYMMPVMDGPTFRKEQLRLETIRSIPVAVMTASGTSRQRIMELFGDVEYLPKPTAGTIIFDFLRRCRTGAALLPTP